MFKNLRLNSCLVAIGLLVIANGSPAFAVDGPSGGQSGNEVRLLKRGPLEKMNNADVPLIPRAQLFGNPERATLRVSPNGEMLAYRAPHEGVMNVWVAPIGKLDDAEVITFDQGTGISSYFWASNSSHILYTQDADGDEDFHLYSVPVAGGDAIDLTPFDNVSARVEGLDEQFPDEVLVGINDREPHYFHDLYRINVVSGERTKVMHNPGFLGFLSDDNFEVRLAIAITGQAEMTVMKRDEDSETQWAPFAKIEAGDVLTTSPIGFDKSGEKLYMLDSRGRNTAALTEVDLETGESKVLAESDKADISEVISHPTDNTIQAVAYTFARREFKVLDDSIQGDLDYLKTVADGEMLITSRTDDDKIWTVAYTLDDGPTKFYLYDRSDKTADFLFSHRPDLEELPLVKMHAEVLKSRDGLDLVSYLSLPADADSDGDARPSEPLPMVLLVHGGPWARDDWGYNPLHQMLANRGYAVLSVNYRGSTGFGKEFINAADKEWAATMHNDLLDAVDWAVEEKIAKQDQVAIMGGSYGGYATLVGLTFTPDTFACGVDIVGPSNLVSLLENPPPYWMPMMPMMKTRVGDWTTDEGKEFLESRSPLFKVQEIERPLLIGQGANDPRVKQSESDQIVEAMVQNQIPVTYMLYPSEGHGFDRPENNQAFFAVTEAFLKEHLGGRAEAIGYAFKGAEFEVPVGANEIEGLPESLRERN